MQAEERPYLQLDISSFYLQLQFEKS
jgi:hypothetical protein